MTYVRSMIVWASGLIEFLAKEDEPEGAILVCTVRNPHTFQQLLDNVHEHSFLHSFNDCVGLRVPGINPNRPQIEVGVDHAVEHLIDWEDDLRDLMGQEVAIEWARS